MGDPLSAIASVLTIAEVACKIFNTLADFVKAAKNINSTAADLQSRIDLLRQRVDAIKRVLIARDEQGTPLSDHEECIRELIKALLKRCRRSLRAFEKALDGLQIGKEDSAWLRKALLQMKYERKNPIIIRLEKSIDGHNNELLHLQSSLESVTQRRAHTEIMNSLRYLERAMAEVTAPRASVQRQTSQEGVVDAFSARPRDLETDIAVDIYDEEDQRSMSGALNSLKKSFDPGADYPQSWPQGTGSDSDSGEETIHFNETGSADGKDPTPDFDDRTHPDVLTELIRQFQRQVDIDRDASCHQRAEISQRQKIELLEEQQASYGIPFSTKAEELKLLANIYKDLGRLDDRLRVIRDANPDEGNAQMTIHRPVVKMADKVARDRGNYFYLCAQAHHEIYLKYPEKRADLQEAEKYAKRAFKCRLEICEVHDQQFLEAVKLVVQIYEDQGKMVHAETYRSMYLLTPREPSPPPPANPPDLVDAIKKGNDDLVERILRGLNDKEVEKLVDNKTPLQHAIDCESEKTIRKLINRGADAGQGLIHAVQEGNQKMATLLLKLDGDIEYKHPNSGLTPLLIAIEQKHTKIMNMLLDRNADPNAPVLDNENWTALHYVVNTGDKSLLLDFLRSSPTRKPIELDATCEYGKTALHFLAQSGDTTLGQILVDMSANVNKNDEGERNCLHVAVENGKYDFVEMLLKKGGVKFTMASMPSDISPDIETLLNNSGQAQDDPVLLLPKRKNKWGSILSLKRMLSRS